MCSCEGYSEPSPPVTIGGPSGDYFVECPCQSCRWAEYAIVGVSSTAAATFVVSGDSIPKALDITGGVTLNNDAAVPGVALSTGSNSPSFAYDPECFYRITHSQKRVFVRIDITSSQDAYITLRFRWKLLTVIPGPAPQVHPDSYHQLNLARADTTMKRLASAGIPGYVEEGGGMEK